MESILVFVVFQELLEDVLRYDPLFELSTNQKRFQVRDKFRPHVKLMEKCEHFGEEEVCSINTKAELNSNLNCNFVSSIIITLLVSNRRPQVLLLKLVNDSLNACLQQFLHVGLHLGFSYFLFVCNF